MRGPRPFRLFLMVILALTPLAQSFWFGQAWHVIDAVVWSGPRALLQVLWSVAALVVLAAALDLLRVRVLPHRAFGPWGRVIARLWLIASCLSFLAMTAVGSLAWFSRPAMAALPVYVHVPKLYAGELGMPLALIGALDLNVVGYAIVTLFVLTWAIAVAIWRFARIEEKWGAGLLDADR